MHRRVVLAGVTAGVLIFGLTVPASAAPTPDTTISSGPGSVTSSTSATFAFTSTRSPATFACRLDGAAAVACTSPRAYSGLAAGTHTFSVAATAGGVTDPTPAQQSWTIDTTPPGAPTNLAATTPSPTSVALTWSAGTDNTGVTGNQILRDGVKIATVAAVTSYTDSTVAASSTHSYAVVAVDGAGNQSPASAPVSATTPAGPTAPDTVIDSGPAALTNATGATFAFHSTASGSTFSCLLDTRKAAACTSPTTYTGLTDGAHTFSVAATANGLTDTTPATARWQVDTTAPSVPTGVTASAQSGTAVTVAWTASTDATGVTGYDLYRNGTLLVPLGAVTSYSDSGLVPSTIYRYAVRAHDGAGNVSALSTAAAIIPRAAYDPHLSRAPYLTDLVGLHVAINFATDRSAATADVKYGAVDGTGNCTPGTDAAPTRLSITVGTVLEYQWTAQVDLPAAGTYCYRVYLGGTDLLATNASPRFTTQEPVGSTSSFSFDVMGDWGQVDANGGNAGQANLLTQVAASGARFMVSVGDNGYPNGNQINYGDLQQTGADTSAIFGPSMWTVPGASMPIFTAVGNHGVSGVTHTDITTWPQASAVSSSGGRYQNDVYCCVNGTTSSNYGSEWYAFSAGNARFYVLDSAWGDTNAGTATPYANDALAHFAPGTPEYTWLLNDLQTHSSQLKFAFSHYPFYSDNNTQQSDTYLQGAAGLEGLLGQHGVQLVFNGHAHIYERNAASATGMPMTYVTGGGGATLEPVGPCVTTVDAYAIGWSPTNNAGSACGAARAPAAAANVYHFLKVTVSGTSVTVTPTDSLGNTFDVRTYTFKQAPDTYIDSAPPAGTKSTSATFAFHASGTPATYSCRLDGGTASACTSPKTYTGLAQGAHTFTVAATVNKQVDPTPATAGWTVDTTAPAPPTGLAATTPSPFEVDLTWNAATDNTGVTGYRIYRDGAFYKSIGAVTSFADPVLGGSTHQYAVSAVDVAGNESPTSATVSATTAPPPAPAFSDGFESGNLSLWSSTSGLTIQTTTVRTGTYAAEGNTTNGATYARKTLPGQYPDAYARVMVDLVSTASQVNFLRMRDAAGNSIGYVYLDQNGQVGFHNDALGTNTLSDAGISAGWHAIELRIAADSSAGTATGTVQVWLDNVLVGALSSIAVDIGAAPVGGFQIGELQTGRTYDVVFDDAAFGTSRLGPAGDSSPPTTPTGLTATAVSPFEVDLAWTASTDDVGVGGYDIFRDGNQLATVAGSTTTFADTSALPNTAYQYAVRAIDVSANKSALSSPAAVTTPAPAAPLFADGFESGNLSAWTSAVGLAVQGSDVWHGSYAVEGATATGVTWAKKTLPSTYADAYARVAFEVKSQSSQVVLLRLRNTPTGTGGYLYLTSTGRLAFRSDALAAGTVSAVSPGPGWHSLELHLHVNGASSAVETWLDGAAVSDLTIPVLDLGSAAMGVLQIGDTTTTGKWDVNFDDAAFGTSRLGSVGDVSAPTTPTGLTATVASAFEVDLAWSASTDDVGIAGYDVFRDGTQLASVNGSTTSYVDAGVLAGTTYQYTVRARDGSNNVSAPSTPATATTPSAPAPVFADGFESGDVSAWTSAVGLAVQGTDVWHGGFAAEGATATGATWAKKSLPSTYTDAYARVAFEVKSQSSQVVLLRLRNTPTGTGGYLYLTSTGRLAFRSEALTTGTVSATSPGPGWHSLELHLHVNGTSSAVETWLDGAAVPDLTIPVLDLGTAAMGVLQVGDTTTTGTWDINFDDAAFGTSRLGSVGDVAAPSVPQNLAATTPSPFEVDLGWDAASDDTGVAGYDVFRDGTLLASVNGSTTTFADASVLAGTTYQYTVRSRDGSNNVSAPSTPATATTPTAAAPVFADGFESGTLSAWTAAAGLAVQTADVHTGTYAAEGNTTTGATYAKKTLPSTYTDAYARVAFEVKSQVSQVNLLRMRDAAGNSIGYVYLDTSGRLGFHTDATNSNIGSTSTPGAGWHVLELHVDISRGGVGVWLDGSAVAALTTNVTVTAASVGGFQIGETTTARTYDVIFDDAAFGTSRIGVS